MLEHDPSLVRCSTLVPVLSSSVSATSFFLTRSWRPLVRICTRQGMWRRTRSAPIITW